jgi:hypothetical protein
MFHCQKFTEHMYKLSDMALLTQYIMLSVCVNTLTECYSSLYKLKFIVWLAFCRLFEATSVNLEIGDIFLLCLNVQLSHTKILIFLDACTILFNSCKFLCLCMLYLAIF